MALQVETIDTVIIGGGLSGLYAASLLAGKTRSFVVLEARERLGGRILSPEHLGYRSDLGPSWYWPEIHPAMAGLVRELGLEGYRQYEQGYGRFQRRGGTVQTVKGYAMQPLSWRVVGGMAALVEKLRRTIPANAFRLNHPVCAIEKTETGLYVSVGRLEQAPLARFDAARAILALPPRLAAATILFTPELSHHLTQAMLKTGTWMAGQAKFCALYDTPFWRETGLSGQAFSERGPLNEIHDGSSNSGSPFGLTGFVGIPAAQRSQVRGLEDAIVDQLAAIFGPRAAAPDAVFYKDWAREPFTATDYDQPPMTEHPLYAPPDGQTAIWNNTVHFAGTETAHHHGGYLEGALTAARRAVANLEKQTTRP